MPEIERVNLPVCPHCGQLARELLPILFGNGIQDVACRGCIETWVAEFPGWISQQVKDALKERP